MHLLSSLSKREHSLILVFPTREVLVGEFVRSASKVYFRAYSRFT